MSWFKVSNGRLVCQKRLDRAPYTAWVATSPGRSAIAHVASGLGFRLFGKTRAAQRLVWREIDAVARSDEGQRALADAARLFERAVSDLALAPALPRCHVGLRRLVLVPRALAAGRTRSAVVQRFAACRGIGDRPALERDFFIEQVLREIDEGVRVSRPSVRRPIHAGGDWACVGGDTRFLWVDELWSGRGWSGHLFMYEFPPAGLSRRDAKAVESAIADLQTAILDLSRERRHALVKVAASA